MFQAYPGTRQAVARKGKGQNRFCCGPGRTLLGVGGIVAAEDLDATHWVGALTRDVEGSLCSYTLGINVLRGLLLLEMGQSRVGTLNLFNNGDQYCRLVPQMGEKQGVKRARRVSRRFWESRRPTRCAPLSANKRGPLSSSGS